MWGHRASPLRLAIRIAIPVSPPIPACPLDPRAGRRLRADAHALGVRLDLHAHHRLRCQTLEGFALEKEVHVCAIRGRLGARARQPDEPSAGRTTAGLEIELVPESGNDARRGGRDLQLAVARRFARHGPILVNHDG